MILLYLLLILIAPSFSQDYDDYEGNYTGSDTPSKTDLVYGLEYRRLCPENEWLCKPHCAERFLPITNSCLPIQSDLKCFGAPIEYKFTDDFASFRHSHADPFPHQFGALSMFPKCWSHLAPLLCTTIYRPCEERMEYVKQSRSTVIKNEKAEYRRLFHPDLCNRALDACASAIEFGVFPDIIDCKQREREDKFYDSSCLHQSAASLPQTSSGHCPSPLVSAANHHGADFIVDECSLPCRSTVIGEHGLSRLQSTKAVLCGILSVLFFIEAIYLLRFSLVAKYNDASVCVAHALLDASFYFAIWAFSQHKAVWTLAECTSDGLVRKYAERNGVLEWCSTVSVMMQSMLTSSFIWLFLHVVLNLAPPRKLMSTDSGSYPRCTDRRVRVTMLTIIYVSSFLWAITFMLVGLNENDGVSGVCAVGLHSPHRLAAVFLPLIAIGVVVMIYCFVQARKTNALHYQKALNHAAVELETFEDEQRYRRNEIAKKDGKENATIPELAAIAMDKKWLDEFDAEENERRQYNTRRMRAQGLGAEFKNDGFYERMLRKPLSEVDECDKDKYTAPADLLRKVGHRAFAEEMVCLHAESRFRHRYSMWTRWSWSVAIVAFACLAIALSLHSVHFFNRPSEAHSVKAKIRCEMQHAIRNRSLEWFDTSLNLTVRAAKGASQATWCAVALSAHAERAAATVLTTFILLPALPFLLLSAAFLCGCCGYGGMHKVREVRRDWQDICCVMAGKRRRNSEEKLALELMELDCIRSESPSVATGDRKRFASHEMLNALVRPSTPPASHAATEPAMLSNSKLPTEQMNKEISAPVERVDLLNRTQKERAKCEKCDEISSTENIANPEAEQESRMESFVAGSREGHIRERFRIVARSVALLREHLNKCPELRQAVDDENARICSALNRRLLELCHSMLANVVANMPISTELLIVHFQGLAETTRQLFDLLPHWFATIEDERMRDDVRTMLSRVEMFLHMPSPLTADAVQEYRRIERLRNGQQPVTAGSSMAATPAPRQLESIPEEDRPGPSGLQQQALPAQPQVAVSNPGAFSGFAGFGPLNKAPNRPVSSNVRPDVLMPNAPTQANGLSGATPQQRPPQMMSLHSEAYSAVSVGVYTRLPVESLRLRVGQMREVLSGTVYPQELVYLLLLSGDIYSRPQGGEGEVFFKFDDLSQLLASTAAIVGQRSGRQVVTQVDARIEPARLLRSMRRRAVTAAASIGYHYRRHLRNMAARGDNNAAANIDYNPPVMPDLGMETLNNVVSMERIFGEEEMTLVQQVVAAFDVPNPRVVAYRPNIEPMLYFARYLDHVTEREGLPNNERAAFVVDPVPPPDAPNPPRHDGFVMINEDQLGREQADDSETDEEGAAPPF